MNAYGTLSADVTHASARFPDDKSRQGRSRRLSYSKRFDEINSEVTFAGYRFSERNYLTMGEYLDMRYRDGYVGNSKELYTIRATKKLCRPAFVNAHQLVASDLLEPPGDRSLQRIVE